MNGLFAHGHAEKTYFDAVRDNQIPQERHIPMLWWASSQFLGDPANAGRFHHLRAKELDLVSHDNVFHSVLDCAGIESATVDKSLSLCRPEPVPDYRVGLGLSGDISTR